MVNTNNAIIPYKTYFKSLLDVSINAKNVTTSKIIENTVDVFIV